MTIGLVESTFLLVVNDDHESILHRYGDTGLQKFWGHEFDLLESRNVIGHVTIGIGIHVDYWRFIVTMHLSCNVTEIKRFKDNAVTTLTFGVT